MHASAKRITKELPLHKYDLVHVEIPERHEVIKRSDVNASQCLENHALKLVVAASLLPWVRIALALDHTWSIFVQKHVEEDIVVVVLDRIIVHRTQLRYDVHRDVVDQSEVHVDLREQHDSIDDLVPKRRQALEGAEREG